MAEEEKGLKPRYRILALLSLALIVCPIVVSLVVPWTHDMAGIQGFFIGLFVAWIFWRLVEANLKGERFRKAGGMVIGNDDL
jgi:hypothetical protein